MKIAYIAGLSRSGSTFLQLLLSAHPDNVGLGEIAHVIRNLGTAQPRERGYGTCTCGQAVASCPFWGPILPKLERSDPQAAHRQILEHFQRSFPGRLLVDSSKEVRDLRRYYAEETGLRDTDVRVIFLVRDFRGWALSVLKHTKRNGNGKWFTKTYLRSCYVWFLKNLRTMRYLKRCGLPLLLVSYEELVFNTDQQLARISEFLEIPGFHPEEQDVGQAMAHDLYGSPTVKGSERHRTQTVYDHSWMSDWRPVAAFPLLAPVHWLNQRVYREQAALGLAGSP